jgi:glycosyltransferase involved in cell wall biosynthesis
MALITVIIPLYNKEKYIKNTIKSVLRQSFTDFELLLINDGSTDKSVAAVNTFNDSRIQLINQDNKGVSSARNLGIKKARTPFVALLDADDIWQETHLESLIKLQQKYPNKQVFASAYSLQFKNKKQTFILKKTFENPLNFFKNSLQFSILNSSNVLLNKNIFEKIGFFNTQYKGGEDTDFWIRLGLKYAVCFTNEVSLIINKSVLNQASNSLANYNDAGYLLNYLAEEQKNSIFKEYMDYQRYGLLMRYRKIGETHPNEKQIISFIKKQNLNLKQRMLLFLPKKSLRIINPFL